MPKRTDISNMPSQDIPPPLRGRLGGGARNERRYVPQTQELQIRDHSRRLRKNSTEAEKSLWKILRNKQFHGFKFRRQFPIDVYIADLICLEHRLVIELDGGQHAIKKDYDEKRTRYLQAQGFHVLRFWNNDVLQNPEGVTIIILEQLRYPPTQPSPARVEGFKELHAQAH